MRDSSHGSSCVGTGPDVGTVFLKFPYAGAETPHAYRGCSPTLRRRGVARTRPWALRVAGSGCERPSIAPAAAAAPTDEPPAKALPPIVLELEDGVWAGVPCWTGRAERWARWVVPIAYDLYYDTEVRPLMGDNQIGRKTLVAVAVARAQFADFNTGRNSRPTNKTLAPLVGCKERTVQRADKALRLLGVATEVLRGRQRTRAERLASWRVGDRARGWASVWALHDRHTLTSAVVVLSPHPEGSLFMTPNSRSSVLTTGNRRPTGVGGRGAGRRGSPDSGGAALARAWRADPHAPPWARRHSPHAWAALLAGPARHRWCARDINQLITDWAGIHGWIPDTPHTAIGLLGAMLKWHGDLEVRPAALDMAREAAELAAARARVSEQLAAREQSAAARAAARAALAGPGRAAARLAASEAHARSLARRTDAAAHDAAAHDAAVREARGLDPI